MQNYLKYTLFFSLVLFSFIGKIKAQHIVLSTYNGENEIKASGSITLKNGFHLAAPAAGKSVRIYIQASFENCVPFVGMPSSNQNYISTRIFKSPGVNSINLDSARTLCEVNQSIEYFDGLGRPLQTVGVQGSSSFRDIVQPFLYDVYGRESKVYLPYSAKSINSNGAYKADAINDQTSFYNNPDEWSAQGVTQIQGTAFSETKFEPSVLNRVKEQGAPGAPWQILDGNLIGHTKKFVYGRNNLDTNYKTTGFAVRLYRAIPLATGGIERSLTSLGLYAESELTLTISKDENWQASDGKASTIEEYKDKEDRVILKRLFNKTEAGNEEVLSTYYVYDDQGNLTFVLPPGANPDSGSINDLTMRNFCYQYRYDARARLVEKWIPGMSSWSSMVYNTLDQLILSQDAKLKTEGKWMFTKYDVLGKLIMSGVYTDGSSRISLQNAVDVLPYTSLYETRNGNPEYTNSAFPQTNIEVHTVNYYDDYSFTGAANHTYSGASKKTKGLLTGEKIKVLDGNLQPMLMSWNFYDEKGRLIKNYKEHYLSGSQTPTNFDEIENSYKFSGELTANNRIHHVGTVATTITNRFIYDHVGRKVANIESINGNEEVVLSKLEYNELGQILRKNLHSTDGGNNYLHQSVNDYNSRGWLRNVSSAQFSFQLQYQEGDNPQWNGNISGQKWGTFASFPNKFSYRYDKLNRLVNGTSIGLAMSEVLTYNLMGNIQTLTRDGGTTGSYSYEGNKLKKINNGPLATELYTYDENGNSIKDGRNGYNLTYNILNLPSLATKGTTTIAYVYDAIGRKLRKTSGGINHDYIDGIEYNAGTIENIQTEEGVARKNGVNYSYEYNLKDHLGNVRYVFYKNPANGILTKLQETNYYPFGKTNSLSQGENKYLYNSKELQDGLDQIDYGARFYDPVIGRWNVVDPITDLRPNISPYTYCVNNPILYVDKFGLDSLNAIHYLKEVVIRGYKTLATISPLFPKLDNSLKMFTDWTDQKKDKYPAGNFTDLAYNATRRNAQASVVNGDLLSRVKKDPKFLAWRKKIIAQYKLNPLINKNRREVLKLGGDKFFSFEGDIELRLSIRGVTLNANFAESNGTTNINYSIDDTFDIRQQEGRGALYNGINGFLEPIWVDVFHGNEDMKVEGRWNETITR